MTVNVHTLFEPIQTERLQLRAPVGEDASAVFAIHGDPDTNRYNPHGPMKSRKEAVDRLIGWQRDWAHDGYGYWSIMDPSSQEIIGFGGIRRMQLSGRDVLNLYYRISPKSWGYGYATEVASKAIELARKHLPAFPVVARISPVNTPSIKVAERVGMVVTPELNDSEYTVFTFGW